MAFKLSTPTFFKEDLHRKMIALFFALLIWYFVNRHISEVETFKNITVHVSSASSDHIVVSVSKTISIELRGPKEILNRLESKDIQVSVIGNFTTGINEVLIKEDDIKLPSGIKVEKIDDRRVSVDVDTIEEKDVNVRLRYNNKLSPNYELAVEPYVKPDLVTVRGPSRVLAKIPYLDTKTITIDSRRTNDFRVTTKVIPIENIQMTYDSVTVYVELKKRLIKKSLPVQKVYILHTSDKESQVSSAAIGEAFAYVSGPPEVIENIDVNKDVRLFIERGDEDQESYEIKFWCRFGSVIKESITPSKISLKSPNEEE